MRLNRLIVCPLAVALVAAGCTREPETSPVEEVEPSKVAVGPTTAAPATAYTCDSGQTVMVQYPDPATAQIGYNGRSYAMRLVPSASGARYSGSGLEWWSASRGGQESAVLSRLGPSQDVGVAVLERCGRAAAGPAAPSPAPGELPLTTPGAVLPASTPCRAAQLRLTSEAGDAGAGNRANVFALTNTGTAPCSLAGYPSVRLLDSGGRAVDAVRSDQNPALSTPVRVPANGKAYFDIAWNVVPDESAGERVCPAVAGIRVMVPSDPAGLVLPLALTPCGGRIRVNPFRETVEPALTPPPAVASSST